MQYKNGSWFWLNFCSKLKNLFLPQNYQMVLHLYQRVSDVTDCIKHLFDLWPGDSLVVSRDLKKWVIVLLLLVQIWLLFLFILPFFFLMFVIVFVHFPVYYVCLFSFLYCLVYPFSVSLIPTLLENKCVWTVIFR